MTPKKTLILIFVSLSSLPVLHAGPPPAPSLSDDAHKDIVWENYRVVTPSNTLSVPGVVRPLFWKCKLESLECELPLENVEFVAKHNYIVDGKLDVTEATVIMKSKTFVRFYFMDKVGKGESLPNSIYNSAEQNAERVLPDQIKSAHPSSSDEKVVKNYPVTTHAQMVEYRVLNKKTIDEIYESIYDTMIEYRAFPLAKMNRPQTIRDCTPSSK